MLRIDEERLHEQRCWWHVKSMSNLML